MSNRRAATLPVRFFHRPADVVARDLVGCLVVSRLGDALTAARIVETEAYLGVDDPASHAWKGRRNAQNDAIYGAPATWYVYRSYGIHWCANLVCLQEGVAAAVLLRALEPLEGLEVMRARRGGVPDRLLASGPGRLTMALGMTRALDGEPMRTSAVTVHPAERATAITTTARVGITRAAEWPLRFVETGSPWASGPRLTSPRATRRG
ncbi:MAG TPA: DNA-3-methyladenine glycosylase [Gemmatimonadales bacterium]|jgi:DNA-3-methyladenine glycosylase|nr:DNA-3-methyladenine glycosylase [Gemmatimonadales bacterium]